MEDFFRTIFNKSEFAFFIVYRNHCTHICACCYLSIVETIAGIYLENRRKSAVVLSVFHLMFWSIKTVIMLLLLWLWLFSLLQLLFLMSAKVLMSD